ncbi:MAG: Hpt domain-containing protein [Deltaproteobacteria bacterium]|nr:Hpt domain-containing protein [Deltaproteobacteria bacterium]MBW2359814.1 Hpt domain-containing protein [Deltaproteobacteria bacterium]
MSKYRDVFLEEATEHLAEMSRALLELEKDAARAESIDLLFRMAHSIKGMAASLEYDAITQVAHRLEDHMQEVRSAGVAVDVAGMALLFRGLEMLESMVASVRETGEAPAHALQLNPAAAALVDPPDGEGAEKKA